MTHSRPHGLRSGELTQPRAKITHRSPLIVLPFDARLKSRTHCSVKIDASLAVAAVQGDALTALCRGCGLIRI